MTCLLVVFHLEMDREIPSGVLQVSDLFLPLPSIKQKHNEKQINPGIVTDHGNCLIR